MLVLWAMLAEMSDAYKGINWASEKNAGVIYLQNQCDVLSLDSRYQIQRLGLIGLELPVSIIKYGIPRDPDPLTFLSEKEITWSSEDPQNINEIVLAGINLYKLFSGVNLAQSIWDNSIRNYAGLLAARGVFKIRSLSGELFPLDLLTAYDSNVPSAFWTY